MEIQKKIKLGPFTSWLVGGDADYFCRPTGIDELKSAIEFAQSKKLPIVIMGGGSNILVSDRGVRGLVICMQKLAGLTTIEEHGRLKIEVLAGTGKNELLKVFLKSKLAPSLFLAGLPGDVGGGVVMNAGVAEEFKPREFCEIVDWFEVLKYDNQKIWTEKYTHTQVEWSYRHSAGWQPGIVTKVGISWPLERDATILEQVKTANRTRLSKQPLDMPSCGSVFVNPPGNKSAKLIDESGLKGFSIGGAQVSTKHANFIVNTGNAKASEIHSVIEQVKAVVKSKTGVSLRTEVIYLGDWT
ncbi:MAG: UDP-N-acetylmuramate dehydrogenase [Pseudobdellovibrionaceae bacterium]